MHQARGNACKHLTGIFLVHMTSFVDINRQFAMHAQMVQKIRTNSTSLLALEVNLREQVYKVVLPPKKMKTRCAIVTRRAKK